MSTNQPTSVWQVITHNTAGNDSAWFWTMVQAIGVILTLYLILRQIRLQRMANTLTTLADFQRRWEANEMSEARKAICKAYREQKPLPVQSAERVSCFFEELGLYRHKKVFDKYTVWELYSYYVEHYWPLLKPRIEDMRKEDKTVYTSFEALHRETKKVSKKRGAPTDAKPPEVLAEFIKEELAKS